MNASTRKRIEAAGGRVTTVREFLGLSNVEMAVVEIKVALARALRAQRQTADLTQEEAAKLFGSSQSRVAKMEAGDPSVSMDLLVFSMLKLGASPLSVGKVIEKVSPPTSSVSAQRIPTAARTAVVVSRDVQKTARGSRERSAVRSRRASAQSRG
jgi:transcriptional regulator with XRE-family HTH domain